MDRIFVPALPADFVHAVTDTLPPKSFSQACLRRTEEHPYSHALMAYPYWVKERFVLPNDSYLFGDSGGYSIMTQGIPVDPIDVLRWQEHNCTVGAILDVPPKDKHGHFIWATALARTKRNVARALPLYREFLEEGTAFRWWGVVQGGTHAQLTEWWDAIRRIYRFDNGEGLCFKPYPRINAVTLARVLRFVQDHGFPRAHFLMVSSALDTATLIALAPRTGLELVTHDATSAHYYAARRFIIDSSMDDLNFGHLMHKQLKKSLALIHGKEKDRYTWGHMLECPCASCAGLRNDIEEASDLIEDPSYATNRMTYHNLLVMLRVYRNQEQLAEEDPEQLLKTLMPHRFSAIMRAFENREKTTVAHGTPRSLLSWADDDTSE